MGLLAEKSYWKWRGRVQCRAIDKLTYFLYQIAPSFDYLPFLMNAELIGQLS
jgi:hypothetical protein